MSKWYHHANCQGEPIDTFFPSRGGRAAKALRICAGCVVRQECLDACMIEERDLGIMMTFGIRGGLTAAERVALRSGQSPESEQLTAS